MSEVSKRFSRSQKAAELRYKELEAEKHEFPLYYELFKDNDPSKDYPFVKVAEFNDSEEAMSYLDSVLINESEF